MKSSYFIFLLIIAAVSGCKKLVDTYRPPSRMTSTEVWSSNATAAAVLTKLYSDMSISSKLSSTGGISYTAALLADELKLYAPNAELNEFYTNAVRSNRDFGIWASFYTNIYITNEACEQLPLSSGVSEAVKRQLTGEAKFIRSFSYFYLVNMFGDVPLILTTDYEKNRLATRTAATEVYAQIIADLHEAIQFLSDEYLAADVISATSDRFRPNKATAHALLARVYLYTGDYIRAEEFSSAVIDDPRYQLIADLNNVFSVNNEEAIWQLQSVIPNRNTMEGDAFVLVGAPDFESPSALSSQLEDAFEPTDQRNNFWVGEVSDGVSIYRYSNKYKIGRNISEPQPLTEHLVMLRLAEQYLIRAEARARQGKLTGPSSATSDINAIRSRAGLNPININEQNAMLEKILHERQTELFCEFGHRWLDLKRTGLIDIVMTAVADSKGASWAGYKALLPIPQESIRTAPGLKGDQNPGYE